MTRNARAVGSMAWWSFAEAVATRFTRPPVDIASVDADVAEVFEKSAIASALRSAAAATHRGWRESRLCRLADSVMKTWRPLDRRQRQRASTLLAVTAVAVALILQMFRYR